jgi:hypothetical protein
MQDKLIQVRVKQDDGTAIVHSFDTSEQAIDYLKHLKKSQKKSKPKNS